MIDTNVVISGLIRPQSVPGEVLRLFVDKSAFELVLSEPLLEEIGRALRYPKIRKRIRLSEEEIGLFLSLLDALSLPVEGKLQLSGVASDSDDDKVIATAIEANASHVVTGDRGLLEIGKYQGVRFVTPRAFLELLTAAGSPL